MTKQYALYINGELVMMASDTSILYERINEERAIDPKKANAYLIKEVREVREDEKN